MYNNKQIEDVLKYLYKNKQDDLAKVVVEMIAQNATSLAQANMIKEYKITTPIEPKYIKPMPNQPYYGDPV